MALCFTQGYLYPVPSGQIVGLVPSGDIVENFVWPCDEVRITLSTDMLIRVENPIPPKTESESQTKLSEGREVAFGLPASRPSKGRTISA